MADPETELGKMKKQKHSMVSSVTRPEQEDISKVEKENQMQVSCCGWKFHVLDARR